ncbi:hypothetical protein BJF84_17140 [Rhodococcus sp. CUA-806]|nr:hypothetical protein BJF84_17140 [Rhodococcus sp. CUA-806]
MKAETGTHSRVTVDGELDDGTRRITIQVDFESEPVEDSNLLLHLIETGELKLTKASGESVELVAHLFDLPVETVSKGRAVVRATLALPPGTYHSEWRLAATSLPARELLRQQIVID